MSSAHIKNRAEHAEAAIARLFERAGWHVEGWRRSSDAGPDLVVELAGSRFAIFIKAPAEARSDRVIPLLSQAILQARVGASEVGDARPLPMIFLERVSEALLDHITSFVDRYAPGVAVGVVTEDGLRKFVGEGLEALNAEPRMSARGARPPSLQVVNLFSDLNQWMLKVLLAPELPEDLLSAPRRRAYRSGIDLATAAGVSSMSASRFLQQLRAEGFLDNDASSISLVRRPELFRRWRAAATRPPVEMPVRFVIKASTDRQIRRLMNSDVDGVCLGMFAAADELRVGHVSGVLPYLYVPKMPHLQNEWKSLMPATAESADLILRQVHAPQSTFRGAVHRNGLLVTDVIQVWLDVSNHPARGAEQAELIYRNVLRPFVGEMN